MTQYNSGETARAIYLGVRGAGVAIRGGDPAASKWDRKLNELAAKAAQREEIEQAARDKVAQEKRDAKVEAKAERLRRK